jgi:hypothetical protein
MRLTLFVVTAAAVLGSAAVVQAREPGDPIRLRWVEGDVAGMTAVYDPTGRGDPIGVVEYRQTVRGDRLSAARVTRFRDGSSDEDTAEARVGRTLEAIGGRSIIRDAQGAVLVDITIDVAAGRIAASWGGADHRTMDERVDLPAGTYWGPLIFLVLKNFEANAEGGELVFRTVAPTPRPMVLDMALRRGDRETLERAGARLDARHFELTPTVHWAVDPVIRLVAPVANFWTLPGDPPALARFSGPRNYGRQPILIQ